MVRLGVAPGLGPGEADLGKPTSSTGPGAAPLVIDVDSTICKVEAKTKPGATGEIVMRFGSGFWSKDTIASLGRLGVRYTMAGRTNTKGIAAAISAIDERVHGRHRLHP